MLSSVKYTIDLIYGYTGIEIAAGKVLLVLMGVGISSLLLVMALILMLLRKFTGSSGKAKHAQKDQKQEPQLEAAAAVEAKAPEAKGGVFSFLKKRDKSAQAASDTSGFVFLKKKSRKGRKAADQIEPLSAIETEMLALKELYNTGHITADVYVAESRALYEKARQYA